MLLFLVDLINIEILVFVQFFTLAAQEFCWRPKGSSTVCLQVTLAKVHSLCLRYNFLRRRWILSLMMSS